MFKDYVYIFILLFFHEMGHLLMGRLCGFKVKKIVFYPYGGCTYFEYHLDVELYKEWLVLVMGPIFQILTFLVLQKIFNSDLEVFKNYHYSLLFFNMLPIYPLDGGKLVQLIFLGNNSFRVGYFSTIVISLISLVVFIFYYFRVDQIFILILLIFKLLDSMKNYRFLYQKFLLEKYLYFKCYKKIRLIDNQKDFYRNSFHFINNKGKVISERKFLYEYFNS